MKHHIQAFPVMDFLRRFSVDWDGRTLQALRVERTKGVVDMTDEAFHHALKTPGSTINVDLRALSQRGARLEVNSQ